MESAYLTYLESPEWWQQRKAALARAGYRCERECPGGPRHRGRLEVHHRTYQRLGAELSEDLEVLCETCHADQGLTRNRGMRQRESMGQGRLFDRWHIPPKRRHCPGGLLKLRR